MPDDFRLALLKRLTTYLATEVTTANGYTVDLTDAVLRGRLIYGEGDPLPMVSLLEEPIPPDADFAALDAVASRGDWRLMVQGFIRDDPEFPTDAAYPLLADVKVALSKLKDNREEPAGILGFGSRAPMIDQLEFGSGVVRPPDEISAKAYFWLSLTLTLVEDHANPYVYADL